MKLDLNPTEIQILLEGINNIHPALTESSLEDVGALWTKLSNAANGVVESSGPENISEELQILDKVTYDKQRGYINGQIGGKWIVQVQGSTYLVDPAELKEYHAKPDIITQPHMKFDEKTQALLFEQYVRCGVYVGNVPIRLNDCYVKYNQYEKASADQAVRLLIEGASIFMPKNQVRILENINDFANPDNYVPGVLVNEEGEALESILVNAIDYTQAIGDADPIKIIMKTQEGEQEMQTIPKSKVRTLSV